MLVCVCMVYICACVCDCLLLLYRRVDGVHHHKILHHDGMWRFEKAVWYSTYIHIYIHTCTHTHTHMHAYIHTHTYIHAYIHTLHAYTHHTYIHTHTYIYMHTCIHTYMHTYSYHGDLLLSIGCDGRGREFGRSSGHLHEELCQGQMHKTVWRWIISKLHLRLGTTRQAMELEI